MTSLSADLHGGNFSTSSTIIFYKIRKSYPYYGILSISIATIYILYQVIATFCHKILLSVQLFIGNMVLAADIFYTYIKLYQYSKRHYVDKECPIKNPPSTGYCYRNSIGDEWETILTLWVYFVMFCILYPIFFTIGCRFCNRINCCTTHRDNIETLLRYLGIIGGVFFVLCGLAMLIIIIIVRKTDFNIMEEKIGIASETEEWFIILVVILVTIFAFNAFALSHCRDRTKIMYDNCIRKRNHQPYSAGIIDSPDSSIADTVSIRHSSE